MTDEDRWFQDYRKTILTRLRRRKKSIDRVKVAILDSGIDLDNDFIPDSKRLKAALSFVDGSDKMETTDTCRHGTAVAALIKKTAPHADVYVARITSDGNSLRQNSLVAVCLFQARQSLLAMLTNSRHSIMHWSSGKST